MQLQQMSQKHEIYRNAELRNKGCSLNGETRNIICREN